MSLSLPTLTTGGASLWLQLEADAGLSLSDGSPASTWADQSGNGMNVTASGGNRPTYYSQRWPGGRPCLTFTSGGTSRLLAASAADWKFLNDGSAWTAFCVYRTNSQSSIAGSEMVLLDTGGWASTATGWLMYFSNLSGHSGRGEIDVSRGVSGQYGAIVGFDSSQTPLGVNNLSATFDGSSTFQLFNWGVSAGTGSVLNALANSNPDAALTIGKRATASAQYADCDYAAVLIYKGALNSADRNAINAYLEAKYHPAGNNTSGYLLDALTGSSSEIYAKSGLIQTIPLPTKYGSNPVLDSGAGSGWDYEKEWPWVSLESGTYKMWYSAADSSTNINSGYATSSDGITWTKSNLGQVSFGGNTNNNILFESGDFSEGACHNPNGLSGQQYLRVMLIWTAGGGGAGIQVQGSADGVTGWAVLKTLQTSNTAGEGGFIIVRADGRLCVLYENHTGPSSRRNTGLFISNTNDATGTWTDYGETYTAPDASHQAYAFSPTNIGPLWFTLGAVYSPTEGAAVIAAFFTRDEGWTWGQLQGAWISKSASGFDSKQTYPGNLLAVGSDYRAYYLGTDVDHATHSANAAFGYATVSNQRLAGWRPAPSGSVVQSLTANGSTTAVASFQSGAFGTAITSGNAVVVFVWYDGNGAVATVSAITDTAGNTGYVLLKTANTGNTSCDVWICLNATGGSSFKVTATTSRNSYISVCGMEVANVLDVVLDGTNSNTGSGANFTATTGAFSTVNANDLLIAAFGAGGLSGVTTAPTGFLNISKSTTGGTKEDGSADYRIVSAAQSSLNPTWVTTGPSTSWAAVAVALKIGAGASSGTYTTRAIYQTTADANAIFVNADASGGGSITAALLDEQGGAVSGFGDADSTVVSTNTTSSQIRWGNRGLPARLVRVRLTLTSATLYSWTVATFVPPVTTPAGVITTKRKQATSLLDVNCPINWDHPLNRGLMACWMVPPNSGWRGGLTLRDLVRGAKSPHDGTLQNGLAWSGTGRRPGGYGSLGQIGAAAGPTQYVSISNGLFGSSGTIAGWIWTGNQWPVWRDTHLYKSLSLYFGIHGNNGSGSQFFIKIWDNTADSHITVAAGAPANSTAYHLVGTWGPSSLLRLYVNGSLIGSASISSPQVQTSSSAMLMSYGDQSTSQADWKGPTYHDDIRAYNTAFSTAEVAALYDQSRRGHPDTMRWLKKTTYFNNQAIVATTPAGVVPSRRKQSADIIDVNCPINWDHQLNKGLISNWMVIPNSGWRGGLTLRDLVRGGKKPNDGTLVGGPTFVGSKSRAGGFGAISFDGSNDKVVFPNSASVTGISSYLTISLWMRPASGGGSYPVVFRKSDNTGAPQFGFSIAQVSDTSGAIIWEVVTSSNQSLVDSSSFTAGTWYSLICVFTANATQTIYVNGIQTATRTPSGGNITWNSSSMTLATVGDSQNAAWYSGSLDDVRLFNRALSAGEAADLYKEGASSYRNTLKRIKKVSYYVDQSGSNSVSRTATDTLTGAETLTRLANLYRTLTDAPTYSDIVTIPTNNRTSTDALTFSESLIRLASEPRIVIDAPIYSESLIRSFNPSRATIDAPIYSESLLRSEQLIRLITDAPNYSESLIRSFNPSRVSTNTVIYSESVIRAYNPSRTSTDAPIYSESLIRAYNPSRTVTDTDTYSESLVRTFNPSRTISDNPIFSESVVRAFNPSRTAIDTPIYSESLIRTFNPSRTVTDNPIFSESLARIGTFNRTDTDSLVYSESLAALTGPVRSASESIIYSESAVRTETLFRTDSESLIYSDSDTNTKSGVRTATEAYTYSESLIRLELLSRITTDSPNISESINRLASANRSTTNTSVYSESLIRLLIAYRTDTDALVVSESIFATSGKLLTATESLMFAESLGRIVSLYRIDTDSIVSTESISTVRTLLRVDVDAINYADAVIGSSGKSATAIDTLIQSESLIRSSSNTRATTDTLIASLDAVRMVTLARATVDHLISTNFAHFGADLEFLLTQTIIVSHSVYRYRQHTKSVVIDVKKRKKPTTVINVRTIPPSSTVGDL